MACGRSALASADGMDGGCIAGQPPFGRVRVPEIGT